MESGDRLELFLDWKGRQSPMGDSSPRHKLFIRWASSGDKELVADWGAVNLHDQQGYVVWQSGDWFVFKVGKQIYMSDRSAKKPNWKDWYLPPSPELYAALRRRLLDAGWVETSKTNSWGNVTNMLRFDQGRRNYWISDTVSGGINLPYEVISIDFDTNQITLRGWGTSMNLPSELVFKAEQGESVDRAWTYVEIGGK